MKNTGRKKEKEEEEKKKHREKRAEEYRVMSRINYKDNRNTGRRVVIVYGYNPHDFKRKISS